MCCNFDNTDALKKLVKKKRSINLTANIYIVMQHER
jgi:hypothetical protein